MSEANGDLLTIYDAAPLTPRYWGSMLLLVLQAMFDFFDFFIVGYIVAVLAPIWHLTYGQSAIMLMGGGVGAIVGSLIIGQLADHFGRKPAAIIANLIVACGAGGIAIMPENSWVLFAMFRIVIGFGLGAAQAAQVVITVEMTPTRYRTFISSAMVAPASLGIILAAALASTLLPVIGWRGLSAIGMVPALLALLMVPVMPESPRWLITQGRFAAARRAAASLMGMAETTLPMPTSLSLASKPRPAKLRELLRYPRAFWLIVLTWFAMSTTTYGYQLWSPAILSSALHIPVHAVAGYFTVVGFSGLIGRFVFSALPLWIGRRRTGQVMALGAAIFIFSAGICHADFYGTIPAFIVWLTATAFFVNGGFSNMGPYAPETYPVRLAGSAAGLSQCFNGFGKILGPLALGIIAGGGNVVSPKATDAAVIPGFTFLAACCVVALLTYTFLPIETKGRPLVLTDDPETAALSPASKALGGNPT